jgi:hypothetical protein
MDGAPAVAARAFREVLTMSTLAVVEEILRETAMPLSVKEIVERAGSRLPSKSKTPDTVVARDLSMDIKKKGDTSLFVRTSPGRYSLRELATSAGRDTTSVLSPLRGDRAAPLAAPRAKSASSPTTEREAREASSSRS